jgi:LPS sulfotransferase NodH
MVFVTRPDRVAQAVSLWKAVQTQQWRGGGEADGAEPRYAFAGIDHLARWVERNDDAWRTWFAREGIEPLTIEYDELNDDPAAPVRAVLHHVGLPEIQVPPPPTERQGDDTSREWAERYREEAAVAS